MEIKGLKMRNIKNTMATIATVVILSFTGTKVMAAESGTINNDGLANKQATIECKVSNDGWECTVKFEF